MNVTDSGNVYPDLVSTHHNLEHVGQEQHRVERARQWLVPS